MVTMNRDALIRHWLLGFGSSDLTVQTAGANPTQFEWPNVMAVAGKMDQINALVIKPEVVKAQ
jgi:hypothetical protein